MQDNVDEFKDDLVNSFFNQWITNFTLSVDVFLTLSGCLTAYTWFRKWQRNTTGSTRAPLTIGSVNSLVTP